MSFGYEIVIVALVFNGVLAFGIGLAWSLIPRRVIGFAGFVLFYLGIAVWYALAFSLPMLIYSTFYPLYVIVGLIGFVLGTHFIHKQGNGVKP